MFHSDLQTGQTKTRSNGHLPGIRQLKAIVLGGTILTATAMAPAAYAAPLKDELLHLLNSHPRVAEARSTEAAARENVDQAKGAYFPSFDLNLGAGRERIDRHQQPGGQDTDFVRNNQTLTSSYAIYDAGRRSSSVAAAEANADAAGLNYGLTRQQLLLRGITAYIEVIRSRTLRDISERSENSVRETLNLEDERVAGGAGIAVDVLLAKARLQSAREGTTALIGNLKNAIAGYQQLFDHAPDLGNMQEPVLPADLMPTSLDQAIATGLDENPGMHIARKQIDAAAEQEDVARSQLYPSLNVVGRLNREKNGGGAKDVRREGSIVAQVNWRIFDGFANYSALDAAQHQRSAAMSRLGTRARDVSFRVRTAWNQYETAKERVTLLENAARLTRGVYDARRKQRDAGQATTLIVLDAERETFSSQIALTSAKYDQMIAGFQLLQAMGRLTANDLGLHD